MSEREDLEHRVQNLPAEDLAKFHAWFIEFDHLRWDRQIEADAKAGKLQGLIAEALAHYRAGRALEI
jgi:hypothetical protein